MKIKGKIGISSPSGGGSISIELTDVSSRARFVKVSISYEEFSRALMNQWDRPCEIEVRDLEVVGKERQSKELMFQVTGYDEKALAKKIAQDHCDEGWTAELYFDSQNSFFSGNNGVRYARTRQFRYVEAGDDNDSDNSSASRLKKITSGE